MKLDSISFTTLTDHIIRSEIHIKNEFGMVFKGEDVVANVGIHNLLDSPLRCPGRLVIKDPYGNPAITKKLKVELRPNGLMTIKLEMRCTFTGTLRLTVELQTGYGLCSSWRDIGVLLKPARGFRYNSWFLCDSRGNLEILSALGVKWIRWELSWSAMEPRKGVYNWTEMDRMVESARKNKLYVLALMSHAPKWAIAYGDKVPAHRRGDDSPSPDHLDGYAEFCAKFAQRYSDVVKAYSVWNEPWEGGGISGWGASGYHYRQLTKARWRGVKSVDKSFSWSATTPLPISRTTSPVKKASSKNTSISAPYLHTSSLPISVSSTELSLCASTQSSAGIRRAGATRAPWSRCTQSALQRDSQNSLPFTPAIFTDGTG